MPLDAGEHRRERLRRARLYLALEAQPASKPAEEILHEALAGGVDMLQLRDKHASDEELLRAAAVFRGVCHQHGALFWVNDRPDLALDAGADGVHVGQEDMPVAEVRDLVGPDVLIGLSTHTSDQFAAGLASGVDQLSVGPVFDTPTKAGRPPTGLGLIRHAAAAGTNAAWFAIGGIDRTTVHDVAAAGATRAVVVRAIRDAPDPRRAAEELRGVLERRPVGAAQ
jgi:thiamine-phosphate pyrophosphorylase